MFADANCPSKRNANGYIYSNTYDHAQRHRNSDKYGNSYDYTYRYTLSDSYGYGQTNTYCAASPNTEATSHSAATPLKQPALVSWRGDFWAAHVALRDGRLLLTTMTEQFAEGAN